MREPRNKPTNAPFNEARLTHVCAWCERIDSGSEFVVSTRTRRAYGACGKHVAKAIRYVTIVGRTATVRRER